MRPVESAMIHQQVVHPALGIAADGKAVPSSKSAVPDGDARRGLCAAELDEVIPVADITVFNKDVRSAQVDTVGVGGRPCRSDTQAGRVDVGTVAKKLDMEFRRIHDRDARECHPRAARNVDHGGRTVVGIARVEIVPPGQALAVQGSGAVDGDVRQTASVQETRILGESTEGRHLQGSAAGDLESHVALERYGAAEESPGGNQDRPAITHRVDRGLDGRGVVGASCRGVIGRRSDVDGLGIKGCRKGG